MAVWGDLTNSCEKKRSEKKRRKEKIYSFECRVPKIARRDKKVFLSDQCKEIKEIDTMGKTRDHFDAGSLWGIPLLTKVMRKEALHTQRRDRASGIPPDILEHLPPKNQSLPTLLLCALTSDFTGGCPPPPSCSFCQRVNLQLQLIKFLGN